jgi:hypothetical protein
MEAHAHVRKPLPAPGRFPPFPGSLLGSSGQLPADVLSLYRGAAAEGALHSLAQLTGLGAAQLLEGDPRRTAFPLRGGELRGLQRLQHYLHGATQGSSSISSSEESFSGAAEPDGDVRARTAAVVEPVNEPGAAQTEDNAAGTRNNSPAEPAAAAAPIHSFRDTRMSAVGVDSSAKLSAYLAAGCLSPRMVHAAVVRARQQHGEDTGHSWLIMHLTIRWRCCACSMAAAVTFQHH